MFNFSLGLSVCNICCTSPSSKRFRKNVSRHWLSERATAGIYFKERTTMLPLNFFMASEGKRKWLFPFEELEPAFCPKCFQLPILVPTSHWLELSGPRSFLRFILTAYSDLIYNRTVRVCSAQWMQCLMKSFKKNSVAEQSIKLLG